MHKSEKEVQDKLEQEGWTVYRNGWPDFLAEKDGAFRLLEVKATGNLSPEQVRMFALLQRLLSVPVEVLRPVRLKRRSMKEACEQLTLVQKKLREDTMATFLVTAGITEQKAQEMAKVS